MKKQTIATIIILLCVTLVSAVVIGDIINADFISEEKPSEERFEGEITFLADGKLATCYLDEPNMEIDDDFEECIQNKYAGMRITKVKDWTNRDYKSIIVLEREYRSFDVDKLNKIKEDACIGDRNLSWCVK